MIRRASSAEVDMTTTNAYTYNPLKETRAVRFLRLMPSNSGGQVHCQIFRSHLDDKTEFSALSYAWGSTKKTKSVICNGRKFPVTDNLMSALLRLRLPDEPRVMWIDAICINQEDIAERNQQVSLIREVYMKAQQLIIWLGAGDAWSTAAVGLMRSLAAAQQALTTTGVFKPCNAGREQWTAFSKFLQRSWFARMWIVQELAFAEKEATILLCGTHSFKVETLKDACDWCSQVLFHLEGSKDMRLIFEEVLIGVKRVLVLCDLTNDTSPDEVRSGLWRQWLLLKLAETRDRQATDPRDRLFALYGFLHNEGQPVAVANYSKSVGTVFQEFALDYIVSCKSLDVISEVEELELRSFTSKAPSWVPDWSVEADRMPLLRLTSNLGVKRKEEHASGDIEPAIFPLNDNTILVDGIWFDRIASVSELLLQEEIKPVVPDTGESHILLDLWKRVVSHIDLYPNGIPAIQAFYQTLICGRGDGFSHVMNFVAFWKSIRAPDQEIPTFCINNPEIYHLLSQSSAGAHLLAQMHEMCETEHDLLSLKMEDIMLQSPVSASPTRRSLLYPKDFRANHIRGRSPNPSGPKTQKRSLSAQLRYLSHKRYRDLVVATASNRVFFMTEKGYIGLGVLGTRAGDTVSVLSGGKTPIILRQAELTDRRQMDKKAPRSHLSPLKKHSRVASVVGEAYVHGIMRGEAIKDAFWDRIALV